jgi:hypothetical protein
VSSWCVILVVAGATRFVNHRWHRFIHSWHGLLLAIKAVSTSGAGKSRDTVATEYKTNLCYCSNRAELPAVSLFTI